MFVYDETDRILFTADAFGMYTQPNAEWRLFADGGIIAPGHGPMLGGEIDRYIEALSQ